MMKPFRFNLFKKWRIVETSEDILLHEELAIYKKQLSNKTAQLEKALDKVCRYSSVINRLEEIYDVEIGLNIKTGDVQVVRRGVHALCKKANQRQGCWLSCPYNPYKKPSESGTIMYNILHEF